MTRKVYEVGYQLAKSERYVASLMVDPAMLLIDTRLKPSSWRPEWKEDALRKKFGARYRTAGQFLGNLNYQGGPIVLKNPEAGIAGLVRYLNEGHDLVLLCLCDDYAVCHRHVIVERLLAQMPAVEIVHHMAAIRAAQATLL